MNQKQETAGQKLKEALLADFEFSATEMVLVEEACRIADTLERIEGELESAELLADGSRGQPAENPLLRSARDHGSDLMRVLTSLRLPIVEPEDADPRSAAARKAAMVRWHGRAS